MLKIIIWFCLFAHGCTKPINDWNQREKRSTSDTGKYLQHLQPEDCNRTGCCNYREGVISTRSDCEDIPTVTNDSDDTHVDTYDDDDTPEDTNNCLDDHEEKINYDNEHGNTPCHRRSSSVEDENSMSCDEETPCDEETTCDEESGLDNPGCVCIVHKHFHYHDDDHRHTHFQGRAICYKDCNCSSVDHNDSIGENKQHDRQNNRTKDEIEEKFCCRDCTTLAGNSTTNQTADKLLLNLLLKVVHDDYCGDSIETQESKATNQTTGNLFSKIVRDKRCVCCRRDGKQLQHHKNRDDIHLEYKKNNIKQQLHPHRKKHVFYHSYNDHQRFTK